jgi:hypothetical protein
MNMTKWLVVLTVLMRRSPFPRVPVQKTQPRETRCRGGRNCTQMRNRESFKSEANEEYPYSGISKRKFNNSFIAATESYRVRYSGDD